MNKLMAILFLFGAIGGFGLPPRETFQTQRTGRFGAAVGPVQTVQITRLDRIGYVFIGVVCMTCCLYFIARIRDDDLRK